jgi:hypothetical protein
LIVERENLYHQFTSAIGDELAGEGSPKLFHSLLFIVSLALCSVNSTLILFWYFAIANKHHLFVSI